MNENKLNNKGFTLLEVLISIIILTIVAVPILRGFVSAANTNARAKIKMRTTNAAENLMEDFKTMNLEEIIDQYAQGAGNTIKVPSDMADIYAELISKYANVTADAPVNTYEFAIANVDDVDIDGDGTGDHNSFYKEKLPTDYYAVVTLDSTHYPNNNGANLADMSTVSSKSSAIFTMPATFDDEIYAKYTSENNELVKAGKKVDGILVDNKTMGFFKENLRREIRVDISSTSSFTDAKGDEYPIVKVVTTITYVLDDKGVISENYSDGYVALTRTMFNNKSTQIPLKNIYVLYNPRYEAADKNNGDVISIYNPDNVDANLYIVAQNATGPEWETYLTDGHGPIINIYENIAIPLTDSSVGHLRLKTNISEHADFFKNTVSKNVQCKLLLTKPANASKFERGKAVKTGSYADTKAAKALKAADVSGKLLNSSEVRDRLFDIKVVVYQSSTDESGASTAVPFTTITGSKLE